MSSEMMIVRPSTGTSRGIAAEVPQAITIRSARTRVASPDPRTSRVCGSRKRAAPATRVMPLRRIWSRITSISRWMTCSQRTRRSGIVMRSLTAEADP